MESGINADQNFYSRRHLPPSPDRNQQQQRSYEPPPLPDFDERSPQLPPKLSFLTTQNLQSVTSNGYIGAGLGERDAEQFYKEYRGVQQSASSFTDLSKTMAASTLEVRPSQSSLRSNGNGTTPKHPSVARTALKPSYRSTSNPLDDRTTLNNAKSSPALTTYGNSRQASVKDLLKRFDSNNEQSSSQPPKPTPRITTRGLNVPGYKERVGTQARTTNAQIPAGAGRRAASNVAPARLKSPVQPRTQRTRFATEDQHSNNTLSGQARPVRPRNAVSGTNTQASKSMVNLSPTSPSPPSPQTINRRPLFGEVIGQGTPDIAYGIPSIPGAFPRRTSDSNLHATSAHRRSKSDFDVSPSSPTAWYLGVTPALDDVDTNKTRATPGHNRNHSDFVDTKVNTMNGVSPSFQNQNLSSSSHRPSQPPSSRLPQATHRLSGGSSDSSRASTRASSPFTGKKLSNGKLRKPEQRPWSPAGRAMTPTNNARSRTPTARSPRGKARSPVKIDTNSSLKAYISAPPPKTSPPLRSSRPRQPISAATAATSKPKPPDPSSPKQVRTGMKITRNMSGRDAKDRKISETPLTKDEYAEKRAAIRRAYTKSMTLDEQEKVRANNLYRLREREAKDFAAAEAKKKAGQDVAEPVHVEPLPEPPTSPPPSLHVKTSFQNQQRAFRDPTQFGEDQDSPTLGIPGTFIVDDEEPPSAISNVTGTTEIENEPQTEAARLNRMPSGRRLELSGLSSHVLHMGDQLSPEQALFGMQNMEEDSIKILLDPPSAEPQPETTPTKHRFSRDPSPPGAFVDDHDQPVFASTLTAASPLDSTPVQDAISPLESSDSLPQGDEEANISDLSDTHEMRQIAPEISLRDEAEPMIPESSEEVPSFQLPMLRTALAPPSLSPSDISHEYLNTPVTDMDYESSDGAAKDVLSNAHYDPRDGELSVGQNRTSVWTDYSVDTGDEYSERDDFQKSAAPSKPPPPPKAASEPVPPPKPDGYSPLPSPRFPGDIPHRDSSSRHQLPPLSTGAAFAQELSDSSQGFANITVPLWPTYSPPPPPPPQEPGDASPALSSRSPPTSFYNRRPPSSLYQSSQNGARNPESRRASDDVYSPRPSSSTPRSSTQISFDESTADKHPNSASLPALGKKATHEATAQTKSEETRLFQRRMAIKELIDTESVYLKDMNVVEEIYKGTAEACPKLDGGDIKVIFRNTDQIVAFSTMFLDELKSAGSSIYSPRSAKPRHSSKPGSPAVDDNFSMAGTLSEETDDVRDRKTFVGNVFSKHINKMQAIYTDFLKNSETASARLGTLQNDGAVKVWLSECNLVAKDLTQAWDLDALLVKPVQRITRYQLLIGEIKKKTPSDHPDANSLDTAFSQMGTLLQNIDDLKKRIHMVGKIVGRKRKESDVRTGLAKAFGRTRAEKVQANPNRPRDDEVYLKLHEKFGDDYLRLQVVLRDVEFYTRQVTTWTNDFLRYLSAMELIMRMSASPYPELESKWTRFNMSMRDVGTVALEDHIHNVRKKVIEPFEQIIGAYAPPGLAMKKRAKRRLDYERSLVSKKIDDKLQDQVNQYEALNETLKLELPKLSALTVTIGKICLAQLIHIQTEWYKIWQGKVRAVLEEDQVPKIIKDIVEMYLREFKYVDARMQELGVINGYFDSISKTRGSQSTLDDESLKTDTRPSLTVTNRSERPRPRGISITSDRSPSIPTPDFAKRHSGQFAFSPIVANSPNGHQFPHHTPHTGGHSRAGSGSPATPDGATSSRQYGTSHPRPSTGRSFTSNDGISRPSNDYNSQPRRESASGSTYNLHHTDGPLNNGRPYSGLFHSAMPLPDGHDESQRSSRASSRDRNVSGGYNVLYLAASLFEFNISATKSEAGYPYLTYQAGEIFDVIGEKGELWLAKNQDDPSDQVGWIWSKHFARLATD